MEKGNGQISKFWESEKRCDLIFRSLSDVVIILDLNHNILAVNPALEKVTGLKASDLVGKKCYKFFHHSQHPPANCPLDRLIESGKQETSDVEVEAFNSVFMVTVAPIIGDNGQIEGAIHIVKDISRRKRAEKELEKINRALKTLSAVNKELIRTNDEQQLLDKVCELIVNTGGYRLAWVGIPEDDEEKTVRPVANSGYEAGYLSKIKVSWGDNRLGRGPAGAAIRTRAPVICHNVLTDPMFEPWRKDAIERGYASCMGIPLIYEDNVLGVITIYSADPDAFDQEEMSLLSELADDLAFGIDALRTRAIKREIQNRLRESENKYRRLIHSANDAIFLVDVANGKILESNKKATTLLNIPEKDMVGMHFLQLVPDEYVEEYNRVFQDFLKTGKIKLHTMYVKGKTNENIPVQINANILKLGNKKVALGIVRDITEVRRAEEQLRHAQKMEAIGTMASGIAHDFNNMLSPIIGYTELAMLGMPEDSKGRGYLAEVLKAAQRAKDLIHQILTFCRKGEQKRQILVIQPIIKEALKLFKASLPANIELHEDIDPTCGPVLCDPTQIHQIILNLCTNAYHAMRDSGGKLFVSLRSAVVDEKEAKFHNVQEGKYLCLTIRDTGHGMDDRIKNHIFEPYFTTKGRDEGTGLGLSVVQGIVEGYGGYITVDSELNKGTTFNIYFPVVSDQKSLDDMPSDDSLYGNGEKILVIDDKEEIVQLVKLTLDSLGYDVTGIVNSSDAINLLSKGERFDLIIMAQVMSDMKGIELIERIRKVVKDVPVIFYSGSDMSLPDDMVEQLGIKAILLKPLNRKELATTIKRVLSGN